MKTAVRGYWEETKEKLKERFNLSDEDLYFPDGKESIMLERLQYKLGLTKDELREILIHINDVSFSMK
jgi:hypothetical protein